MHHVHYYDQDGDMYMTLCLSHAADYDDARWVIRQECSCLDYECDACNGTNEATDPV